MSNHSSEMKSFNLEDLDVEALEGRLELAVATLPCTGCNHNCKTDICGQDKPGPINPEPDPKPQPTPPPDGGTIGGIQ